MEIILNSNASNNKNFFYDLLSFIKDEVYPNVDKISNNQKHLKLLFNQFLKKDFYKILLPSHYGGFELSNKDKVDFQICMGMYGGCLAFLQGQLWAPIWLLSISSNQQLAEKYFTQLVESNISIGNSLYQLKPKSTNCPIAEKVDDGYVINGRLSFVTGWGLFDYTLIGAVDLIGNEEIIAIIPFTKQTVKPGVTVSALLDITTMKAAGTVSIDLNNYFISSADIVHTWQRGKFYEHVACFPPFAYTLGIVKTMFALIDVSKINEDTIIKNYLDITHQITVWENRLISFSFGSDSSKHMAELLSFSWSCLGFAALLTGGVCSLKKHSFQRLLQEMLIWLFPRNNSTLMEIWSERLSHCII